MFEWNLLPDRDSPETIKFAVMISVMNSIRKNGLFLAAASLVLFTGACGGGGGGSATGPANSPPAGSGGGSTGQSGFVSGVFQPSANFRASCAAPRTGTDPATGRPFSDIQGSTVDENNWLRSWSNELYLWYDEIVDVDPANHSTPDYFDLMKTFDTTPSGAAKDKFHFTIPTDEYQALSQSGVSAGYGVNFAILESSPPRRIVVAYTEPNLPDQNAAAGLVRGTTILEVDGEDLATSSNVDVLNAGLFPDDVGETHTFRVEDPVTGEARTVSLISASVTTDPVQYTGTVMTDTGPVGYLAFFDHIATAEQELINAIGTLRDQQITDLVLDLRYNGGGFLDIANELAFMIAGSATAAGAAFEELQFNDKHPVFNPVTGATLAPTLFHTTTQGFSVPSGQPLPELGLSRVFVLTGPGTCSASESIINGLRGIDIEVIQIGATTCGKPYGFFPFDNCGTTYFSIQFRGINAKGFGDYSDGFSPANVSRIEGTEVPGCSVADDFLHPLGDPEEARFAAALQYREDGSCPSSGGSGRALSSAKKPLSAVDGIVPKSVWLQNRVMRQW